MLAKVHSSTVLGIEAFLVEVEVDIARGLPAFNTVGLPDAAVKESKDRVRSAVRNSGFEFPPKNITVNLAPADVEKRGAAFDLPIAVGILSALGVVESDGLRDYLILGELSLDGLVKGIRGVLPVAVFARDHSYQGLILPEENAAEAAVVEGLRVFPVKSLAHAVDFVNAGVTITPHRVDRVTMLRQATEDSVDLAEVKGQQHVKRALEVAAAGGHNLLMLGPPGSGKSMLARRLATVLPSMSFEESIETTKIHSVMGLLERGKAMVGMRPFRSPHHSISDAGLVGGGSIPMPGEVSLAHNGVLFLDELPEFRRHVLEVLRQPVEDGHVTISRATVSLTYPARFMLAAAMNPCPCGFLTDPKRECTCTPLQIRRYRARISGPLLDRVDIHVQVPPLTHDELRATQEGEASSIVRERVEQARQIQVERFSNSPLYCNAHMTSRLLKTHCRLDDASQKLLDTAINQLGLSARANDRILKVSRTVADLAGDDRITATHLSEAIQYRTLDRHMGY